MMRLLVLSFVAVLLFATSGFSDEILIDDFTDPIDLVISSGLPGDTAVADESGLANVYGGTRKTTLELVQGDNCSVISVPGHGVTVNTGVFSQSTVKFEYGGVANPLNADLAEMAAFVIAGVYDLEIVTGVTWMTDATVTLTSGLGAGEAEASETVTLSSDGDYNYYLFLGSFAAVDKSDIDYLQVDFGTCYNLNGGLAADYGVESFKFTTDTNDIPEPSTVVMLIASGLALALFRRRK
jgi:PEP-CTERM motif